MKVAKTHDVLPPPPPRIITGNHDDNALGDAVKNCVGCGLILHVSDYASLSRCPHCQRPLAMHDARRRKEEGEDLDALKRAVDLRNRLLEYDRQAREALGAEPQPFSVPPQATTTRHKNNKALLNPNLSGPALQVFLRLQS
jgi:predicted RNA-binding Zn-ribbon protein involved in translation (DUF1610 family)